MPTDAIGLAEALNQRCHCVSVDRNEVERALQADPSVAALYATLLRDRPALFSSSPVFVAREHLDTMAETIEAIEQVVASAPFRAWALALAPAGAHFDPGPRGVFLGYDFHLGSNGPQLIEINTNAGGALLNGSLARAHQACCAEVAIHLESACLPDLERHVVDMFRHEWRLQRGDAELTTIAIVDESPETQYLYPEFLLFRGLFERAGIAASILDPGQIEHRDGALWSDSRRIDLVYNRLTDFHLGGTTSAALRGAYLAGDVVVTPNPHTYALYADKRHLTVLSDDQRLRDWGIDADVRRRLAAGVPRTVVVDAAEREQLWTQRKRLFFKPAGGYGSKAAYRGDKLTRSVWEQIVTRDYVAQEVVPPSQRTILVDGRETALKMDLRNYVYDGRVQLVAARLYQGQATNFRTAGGGFAPVLTEARAAHAAGARPDEGPSDPGCC